MFQLALLLILGLTGLLGGLTKLGGATAATVALRSHLLDTVTTISASEDDATVYDLRGMKDISFSVLSTLNTGFGTGTNFMVCTILGCDTETGTFKPIAGLSTAELVVDVGQQIPSAANAPGVTMPRFIKVRWTETGTISSFTATCRMHYNVDSRGPGKQYQSGYLGG